MKHHVFLHEHPVFTGAELAEHLASHGPVGARTRETFLAYYTKTGRVQRIRQGLYAVVPPGCDPGDHQVDSFHIAAKLAPDAVVSHHAAERQLEQTVQLVGLLRALQEHPFLRDSLVLKGGSALNLFVWDAPRLSVDIGRVEPSLLTDDADLQLKLISHPLLNWKALNVRKHNEQSSENRRR